MPAPADLVHQTSSSTGTGSLTLASVNGKRDFATVFSTGGSDVFDYFISNRSAAEWERGTGHMSDSTTLVRDTVIASSNSNSAVNFTAGTLDVTNDVPAGNQARLDGSVFTGTIQTTSIEVGHASDTTLARVSAGVVSIEGNNIYTAGTDIAAADGGTIGQQTIAMPAGAMKPTTTNGAATGSEELATNDVMKVYLAFDDSTQEHACFDVWMPKGWDEGTLVCQFSWYGTSTSGDVIWGIQAVAVGDDDAQDTAYGTAVEVTDTAKGTANDQTLTAETSAMTVGGSPGAEEIVQFKVYRKAADGSDTFSGDAKLTAVKIHYTIDAGTDS